MLLTQLLKSFTSSILWVFTAYVRVSKLTTKSSGWMLDQYKTNLIDEACANVDHQIQLCIRKQL